MFWNGLYQPKCQEFVSLIYSGPVSLHRRSAQKLAKAIVLINANETDQHAGLIITHQVPVCGRSAYATIIDGLLIAIAASKLDTIPTGQFRANLPLSELQMQTHASFKIFQDRFKCHFGALSPKRLEIQG